MKDIKFKYSNFSLNKLFNRLIFILKKIRNLKNKKEKENDIQLLKLCFIYLINILKSDIQLSSSFIIDIINDKKDSKDSILNILFDIIQTLKETNKTVFIFKKYENELKSFISGLKNFTEMLLNVESKFLMENIEKILLEKCYLFFPFEKFKSDKIFKNTLSTSVKFTACQIS